MDQGRFEACEALLRSAAARAGTQRAEARWGLVLLLRLEGRVAEARRWLEEGFDQMSDPVITLVRLYRLDHDRYPTEGIRQTLERSGNLSPQDDRVWLGKAHLATLLGQFDEARTWLDRCLERRPNDLAVWRMRLDWAIAANRPDEARGTLAHLPAALEPRTRPAMLRAWLAARQGNTQAERAALQESLDLDPVNPPVLERLAEIEIQAGQKEHAAELRRRRAELDRIRKDYEDRLSRITRKPSRDGTARRPTGPPIRLPEVGPDRLRADTRGGEGRPGARIPRRLQDPGRFAARHRDGDQYQGQASRKTSPSNAPLQR